MNAARTAGYTRNFFRLLHELHNLMDEAGDDAVVGIRIQRCMNLLHEIDAVVRQNWACFQNNAHCLSYVLLLNIILQFSICLRILYNTIKYVYNPLVFLTTTALYHTKTFFVLSNLDHCPGTRLCKYDEALTSPIFCQYIWTLRKSCIHKMSHGKPASSFCSLWGNHAQYLVNCECG